MDAAENGSPARRMLGVVVSLPRTTGGRWCSLNYAPVNLSALLRFQSSSPIRRSNTGGTLQNKAIRQKENTYTLRDFK